MILAKDIMSREIMAISRHAGIKDVMRLLAEHKITGLPVVDEEKYLLGVVTEKDVLRMLCDPNTRPRTAADLMTTDIVHFDENDELMEVFDCLVENNFRRVPILAEGKLAGIISRSDIIQFLFEKTAQPRPCEDFVK